MIRKLPITNDGNLASHEMDANDRSYIPAYIDWNSQRDFVTLEGDFMVDELEAILSHIKDFRSRVMEHEESEHKRLRAAWDFAAYGEPWNIRDQATGAFKGLGLASGEVILPATKMDVKIITE